jgi:hypothetical protein
MKVVAQAFELPRSGQMAPEMLAKQATISRAGLAEPFVGLVGEIPCNI